MIRAVFYIQTAILLAIAIGRTALFGQDDQGIEFFEKKIRPVLVEHCFECHATDAKEIRGGLLLDSRQASLDGGDSGPAVVPGKVEESLLIEALRYGEFEMPPKGKLPDDIIADFEKWIEIGAPDPREDKPTKAKKPEIDFEQARQFWAFQPRGNVQPPAVQDHDWPLTDIDRFIIEKLEQQGLKPVADADRRALLRRVTFDLTGLPPTTEEIAAFLDDQSAQAYQRVVDRLLSSAQFGENWGRHWLDLARYADSNGGDINLTYHNAWRYRDYVIKSFNDDKPFRDFIVQQIAGDLMPFADDAQRAENTIASGFLVIGPKMLSERDKEKLYMDVVDEQLDTIGRTFMGLTLGCARCHDHKFDPIPTRDYYALAGILRNTTTVQGIRMNNVNVSGWSELTLPMRPEKVAALADYQRQEKAIDAQIKQLKSELDKLKKQTTFDSAALAGVVVDDADAEKVGNWKASTFVPRYVGAGYVHDNKEDKGNKSIKFRPDLPEAGEYEIRISFASGDGRDAKVPVTIEHADGQTVKHIDQTKTPAVGNLFEPIGRFKFAAGKEAGVTISTEQTTDYVLADAVQFLPVALLDKEDVNSMDAALQTKNQIAKTSEQLAAAEKQLAELKKNAPAVPTAMAPVELAEISDCEIRIRGEPHNRGEKVPRGFLTVARSANEPEISGSQSGRLELARWIADDHHPLTARVIVNRIWQHLFGNGIVDTVDNFGQLGGRPSHPELLDYLANEFVSHDWSVKHTIRAIVLSRVYRLGTQDDAQARKIDPENRLHWIHNRRRLPAESIRDAMLAASGELDLTVGGSVVTGLGEQAVANDPNEKTGQVSAQLQRRSVYLPIIRNDLPDILTIFDFADPDVVVGRRAVTTVPAQALMMMNSPFVRDCGKLLAQRARARYGNDVEKQIEFVYESTLGRLPSSMEVVRATEFMNSPQQAEANPTESSSAQPAQAADPLARFCHVILASTEFRFSE